VFLKKWAYIKIDIPIRNKGVSITEISRPYVIKPKMRVHKLRNDVNW